MKLFSFRIRATSLFILDTGMSTRRCFDPQALRIRVNMSAIGSVMLMKTILGSPYPRRTWERLRDERRTETARQTLPAGFAHARNHSGQRQLAEADAAQAEPAQKRA